MEDWMETHMCGECGIQFAAPAWFWTERRKNHELSWHCPNGHIRVFSGLTEEQKLRNLVDQTRLELQAKVNDANHAKLVAEKERDSAIRAKRKVERRIAHGACPCCNKSFADIANHMLTEHKDFRLPEGKRPKQIAGAA